MRGFAAFPAGPLLYIADPTRARARMARLAGLLRHDAYALLGTEPVADRPEARMVAMDLRRAGSTYRVPVTVVQGPRGRWLVEVVDMQEILGVGPDEARRRHAARRQGSSAQVWKV